jgi:hypothetical protein
MDREAIEIIKNKGERKGGNKTKMCSIFTYYYKHNS